MITRFECNSRIIKYFEKEEDAFAYEYDRVKELQSIGQCKCNIYKGGFGGETKTWTAEKRAIYSEKNVMHSTEQRQRMSKNNPMKNPEIAEKVNSRKRKPVIIDGIKYCSVKAGAEAIAPIETLKQYVAEAVASQNGELISVLLAILKAIKEQNLSVTLDGKEIANNVNKRLGVIY